MKKLNKKQRKQVKGGWSLSGAILSGIGSIFKGAASLVKAQFDGVIGVANSIGGWVMGFKEASKGHAKMSLKVGDSLMSYDDTAKIKAAEDLAEAQMKKGVMNTANPKHVSLAVEPKHVDLDSHHDADNHHLDDPSQLLDHSMHMIDDFMHF